MAITVSRNKLFIVAVGCAALGALGGYGLRTDWPRLKRFDGSFVGRVGPYDVIADDSDYGQQLSLVRVSGDLCVRVPAGLETAPIFVHSPRWDWFGRWGLGGTRQMTFAAAVDSSGKQGDRVYDRNGDGQFDQLYALDGSVFIRVAKPWIEVTVVPGTEGPDPQWRALDTGAVFERALDGSWLQTPSPAGTGLAP